jgi:hypothetical protein
MEGEGNKLRVPGAPCAIIAKRSSGWCPRNPSEDRYGILGTHEPTDNSAPDWHKQGNSTTLSFRGVHESSSTNGVEVDVAADCPIVALFLDHFGPIAPLEHVSGAPSSPSRIKRISRQERLHATGEIRASCIEQEMEVVA